MARLDFEDLAGRLVQPGLVEGQLLVVWVVTDAAKLAELLDALARGGPGDLVRDGLDGAIRFDKVGGRGVQNTGGRVIEEFGRHGLPDDAIVLVRIRLA